MPAVMTSSCYLSLQHSDAKLGDYESLSVSPTYQHRSLRLDLVMATKSDLKSKFQMKCNIQLFGQWILLISHIELEL